ncbi:hypothetical protein V6N12_063775 [Hibiscus sabdariffa]|uniref:ZFYVE26-like TPR repeats domain-containing protein n=1 Tax=Hibiscus sabdariffa TaxID=183260 RepID=A0ABR2AV05_9ROSI
MFSSLIVVAKWHSSYDMAIPNDVLQSSCHQAKHRGESLLRLRINLRVEDSALNQSKPVKTQPGWYLKVKNENTGEKVISDRAVDIYVVIVASLAKRKKGSQLTEFFRNIKGTIDDDDDWDQLLKLHPISFACFLLPTPLCRKVLACVVCGRLKSAFQITSRSGSVTDVQYVAHQVVLLPSVAIYVILIEALHANALPVLDMCKQWLSQYCNLLLNNIFATCFPTPLLRESDGCFWFPQPTTDNRQRHAI